MQCPNCHVEVKDGQKFCGKCGTPMQVQEDLKGQRVKMSRPQTPVEAKSHNILLMKWKILLIPIAILFSAALGIGGTYFFLTNKDEPVITEPAPVVKMEEEEQEIEQEIEIEAMTVEEVAAIVDRISEGLRNEKRAIGEKYNLLYTGDVTDTIYEELKPKLLQYASKANVEGALNETFYATCFDCDIIDFPTPTNYAFAMDYQQQGEGKIIFNATYPSNGMAPYATEEIVELVFEDGDWKYDSLNVSPIELQLTLENATEIVERSELYNSVSFVEAKDDSYIFSTDQDHIQVMKDSGVIYFYEMPKVERAPSQPQSQPQSQQSTRSKSSYAARLDEAEALAASYSGNEDTTMGYIEEYMQQYEVWDDLLNELYGEIKANMSESEFIKLRDIQRAWIKERDDAAERAAAEYQGGSMAGIVYNETMVAYTRNRCYELVALYLSD